MTRMAAALLAGVMVLGSVLVSASQAPDPCVRPQSRQCSRVSPPDRARGLRDAASRCSAPCARWRDANPRARERRERAPRRAHDARDREREARAFRQVSPTDDPCAQPRGGDRGRACEVRDTRLPAPAGPLTVDASPNGGIQVEGWDQPDVLVRAVVQTYGETDADAAAAAAQRARDGRRRRRRRRRPRPQLRRAPLRLVGQLPHLGAARHGAGALGQERRHHACGRCGASRASRPRTAA